MNEVLLERPAPRVGVVRLNRPEFRNALNQDVRLQLAEHFTALARAETVRCTALPHRSGIPMLDAYITAAREIQRREVTANSLIFLLYEGYRRTLKAAPPWT